jgi:hypothetical protein
MMHFNHPSNFRRSFFGANSTKKNNYKQALNALFEPFQRIIQEVTKRELSMNNGCKAIGPKVMLYAAGATKTLQKVLF